LSDLLAIRPIGPVDDLLLADLARHLTDQWGFACHIVKARSNPAHAFNEQRKQYDAKLILKSLMAERPRHIHRLIGVTGADLYVPILKFVYGLAEINGHCALISLHRLNPEFYDQPPNPGVLQRRCEKTALHELGHMLGLTHCRDRRCIMYSSTKIEDTDFKDAALCPSCSDLLAWHRSTTPV